MAVCENKKTVDYEVYESCYGYVNSRCGHGIFLELDNGQRAFAYKYWSLRSGSKVLCTILRKPTNDKLTLVGIDSVVEYAA